PLSVSRFFLHTHLSARSLSSFPTRRSSDLFYFESAAMILTLITVGKMLEARSKGRTTDALKSLMKLAPKTATILRNGQEAEVSIDRKSTRLNSSHVSISYAVFCLKKKSKVT